MKQSKKRKRENTEQLKIYNSVLCYIPSKQKLFYLQDGDGSQMSLEDYEAGFNAYVDFSIFDYLGNGQFDEGDGGIFMYDGENVEHWTEMIEPAIRDELMLDDKNPLTIIYMGSGE